MELLEIENGTWNDKVNFVDENNVVLGYDMGQCCCEHAGYIVFDNEPTEYTTEETNETIEEVNERLKGFVFDVGYVKNIEDESEHNEGNENVVFKATNGDKEIYILLFNSHNGYYGHGFDFSNGDNTIQNSYI